MIYPLTKQSWNYTGYQLFYNEQHFQPGVISHINKYMKCKCNATFGAAWKKKKMSEFSLQQDRPTSG